jgi:hypothetical protein
MQISIRELKVTAPTSQTLLGHVPNMHWMGKKPNFSRIRHTLRGKSLADTVLDMR